MLFKHPHVLYALFLLIIPILVHLFQLRRFQKTAFSNVEFLKQVSQQTRKSAQLKKWLTLLARIVLFASIIIAFAQPYVPAENIALKEKELVIYLDNSFSMQAKGKRGVLLNRAVQELLEQLPQEERFTLFTNNSSYQNTTLASIKEELKELSFSAETNSLKDYIYKGASYFSEDPKTNKQLILITDAQGNLDLPDWNNDIAISLIVSQPEDSQNISIDSLYLTNNFQQNPTLNVNLSSNTQRENTTVTLYNEEQILAKTSVSFDESREASAQFTLSNPIIPKGRVEIIDNGLTYDNSFYVSLNKPELIEVIALSGTDDDFLTRLYPTTEFKYQNFEEKDIDFSALSKVNTLIINELKQIPASLIPILSKHLSDGKHLIIIPPKSKDLSSYTRLTTQLIQLSLGEKIVQERLLTTINYDHPLFENVFDRKVDNFQYPKVQEYSPIRSTSSALLSFENNDPFLIEENGVYVFSSSLSNDITNFKNSPLIVPTFYNIARQSANVPKLYYTVSEVEDIQINAQLKKDRVVQLKNAKEQFIPQQQNLGDNVLITTNKLPEQAGNFDVLQDETSLTTLSYNYSRSESNLNYMDLQSLPDFISVKESVTTFFNERLSENTITGLYKWFLILALIALCIEILLLKFLK
ncbi:BatA and WFA domain-containing protein [Gangjinia marincola]|uniref:BatA and WFA domain-containing protein n=1 Tax=Gangjinia marincola TaxID=578463 RepID=A0ABN1MCW5_9FLAO